MSNEIKDNWYEEFFTGITCEVWEKAIPPDYTRQEVDFLVHQLDLKKGQQLLDAPCGFGRHAIEFAKLGFGVTGIDISETFINTLNKSIAAENLNIRSIHGDLLSVEIKDKYSGAVCLGNSFGYFDIDKIRLFLEKIASCLNPGAKFIINSGMVAESILPNLSHYSSNNSYQVTDITMEVSNDYQVEKGYMISHLTYTRNGSSETQSFKHYVFTLSEIIRLLRACGFKAIETFSSVTGDRYKAGDRQVYIVAMKQ